MIENAPGIYNAPSVYQQGGGGGGWQLSSAWICSHKYQTVKNGKVEWMAQNLNEVFTGMTLADHTDAYEPYFVFRKGYILTDYAAGSIDELNGVTYKARSREIITSYVSHDGWRIPSKTDWIQLFASVENEETKLFMPITKCDYSQRLGTNESGMSLIGLKADGDMSPSTNAYYMTSANSPGRDINYMVRALFYNAEFSQWDNDNNSPVWYVSAHCRLVRNL